jgi:hypothetical protein
MPLGGILVMTRETIIERLIELGFAEGRPGLRAEDGEREQTFRHLGLGAERASLHVSRDRLTANGLYVDQLNAMHPTGHNHKDNPFWEGQALEEALNCLEKRYLSQGVRDLLRAYDALPAAER